MRYCDCNRSQCEALLPNEGDWLVRPSSRRHTHQQPGVEQFALSYRVGGVVKHSLLLFRLDRGWSWSGGWMASATEAITKELQHRGVLPH
jgi:hypothetical protein